MAGLISNVKDIFSIKLKVRHDSYSDQYSRIFMVKILFVGTLIIGLNWYSDKITCIVPNNLELSTDYVADACWIQGFYVYKGFPAEKGTVAYDGIPTNLDHDGRYENGKLCIADTPRKHIPDTDCKPLPKEFYLQYQYLTFFVAAVALLYYLPYVIFTINNSEMIALKSNVKSCDIDIIMQNYFNQKINSRLRMRIRVIINIIIKIMYVISNIFVFLLMDKVLAGRYINFGTDWTTWASLSNEIAHNYMGVRDKPKPGNMLLPTFGICEIHEGSRGVRSTTTDKHKFICEYSQHILYHYVLLVFWFMFVFGIFISILGLFIHVTECCMALSCFQKQTYRPIYHYITFREYEYLEYIRRKNLVMYGLIIDKLIKQRIGETNKEHQAKVDMYAGKTNGLLLPKVV